MHVKTMINGVIPRHTSEGGEVGAAQITGDDQYLVFGGTWHGGPLVNATETQ